MGFNSINYDLIYGLPFQNLYSVERTIEVVLRLQPDRIAFYSYAHVPWVKPGQRHFTEADLPSGEQKRDLYVFGRALLERCRLCRDRDGPLCAEKRIALAGCGCRHFTSQLHGLHLTLCLAA